MAENDDPQPPKARKNLQTSPVFATCVGPSLLSSTHPPTPQASVPQASATPSPAAPIPSPTGPPTAALPTPQASALPAPPTAALPTPQASAPPAAPIPAPPTQPASATGCWNSPSIGAALPTPSTNHPQTPSHRALALLNKNYSPSTPMTPPPPPMMSYGGYRTPHLAQFASPTPSLESLELQLTQSPMTPASRPAPPTPKRRRVEPTVSRPWEGNKENEENTDNINSENVNTAENWRSAKKTMRDIITAINKERSTITKGRRKNKASANRVRELDAAKDDMQRLCKVYCQSITGEWHQEANTLIRDWSYLLKL